MAKLMFLMAQYWWVFSILAAVSGFLRLALASANFQ